MIAKSDVIEFFDRLAPQWDADANHSEEIINIILDNAGVTEGKDVLDVACGTGIMIPHYLKRSVASVTGIDIAPNMVEIARQKFPQGNVKIICGDVEETDLGQKFDCIVVYNAFPHFPNPEHLIEILSGLLKPDGTLTVAHGASREEIDSHHKGSASKVSLGLMPAEDLEKIFRKSLKVTTTLSDDRMYQVVGCKC